jgi:hypothetical protein
MVQAFTQLGIDGHTPTAPLTVDSPLEDNRAFATMNEEVVGAVLARSGKPSRPSKASPPRRPQSPAGTATTSRSTSAVLRLQVPCPPWYTCTAAAWRSAVPPMPIMRAGVNT